MFTRRFTINLWVNDGYLSFIKILLQQLTLSAIFVFFQKWQYSQDTPSAEATLPASSWPKISLSVSVIDRATNVQYRARLRGSWSPIFSDQIMIQSEIKFSEIIWQKPKISIFVNILLKLNFKFFFVFCICIYSKTSSPENFWHIDTLVTAFRIYNSFLQKKALHIFRLFGRDWQNYHQ